MQRIVPPILDEMGYPSPAGQPNSPADLFGLAGPVNRILVFSRI